MATIEFWGRDSIQAHNTGASGIGFYGDGGFGVSVAVGSHQGRTFITDSTGTAEGPELNNTKYASSSGVFIGTSGNANLLLELPNYLSTLNLRFTNGSAVKTQNVKAYGYDRVSKNNDPSGVTLQAAEVIHPNTVQDLSGSGDASWTSIAGSGSVLSLVSSPGISGLSPNGTNTTDVRHDWFVALSASPDSVGAKEFALWFELEYL